MSESCERWCNIAVLDWIGLVYGVHLLGGIDGGARRLEFWGFGATMNPSRSLSMHKSHCVLLVFWGNGVTTNGSQIIEYAIWCWCSLFLATGGTDIQSCYCRCIAFWGIGVTMISSRSLSMQRWESCSLSLTCWMDYEYFWVIVNAPTCYCAICILKYCRETGYREIIALFLGSRGAPVSTHNLTDWARVTSAS